MPAKNWLHLTLLIVIITKHRVMLNVSTTSVIQSASQRRRLNEEGGNNPFALNAALSPPPFPHIPVSTIALATAAAVAAFNVSDSSNRSESHEEDAKMHHPGELEQAAIYQANELMQLVIDQLTSANIAAHSANIALRLTYMSEALDSMNNIGVFPSLSEEQLAMKKQLETKLVEACLAVEAQVSTDAFAAAHYMAPMSTALNILSGLPLSEEQHAKKKELVTKLVEVCLAVGGRRQRE